MKFKKKYFKNFENRQINLITIDGITCSGKSLFANLLQKDLQNKFPDIFILSKDLFLYPREQRIRITKKLIKFNTNQNELHYDLKKLKKLLNFLFVDRKDMSLSLNNLYNRNTGKNDLKINLNYNERRLVIFEGIYVNDDIKFLRKPSYKILIIESVYESLSKKIKRIRDKKISIQLVVSEFARIHLKSFKKYINKNNFDITFSGDKRNFHEIKNGKNIQLLDIENFIKKHIF
tara:strand:- start:149 stop:847 length:699 start_codon:yes stop_codon:yes gene_type:complete